MDLEVGFGRGLGLDKAPRVEPHQWILVATQEEEAQDKCPTWLLPLEGLHLQHPWTLPAEARSHTWLLNLGPEP
jgi:hypothetical protein